MEEEGRKQPQSLAYPNEPSTGKSNSTIFDHERDSGHDEEYIQTMNGRTGLLWLLILAPWLSGCYSLKGYSISPDVHSFYVDNFKLNAQNAPATIPQTFQEALKDKVSRESRLQYSNLNPDLEFSGTIQSYNVSAVAPKPDEQTSFNRLTIYVAVEYTNHLDAKDQWQKTFSHFADFPTDQNLLEVQEELIQIIFNQILEDIFNQAFNNW